ncbi:NADPH:quinone reductase [Spirosomataceae bacterium TFI 002]|nr:NADPH:quinone reductase [Spirosomataceae bacterium TFI 002]
MKALLLTAPNTLNLTEVEKPQVSKGKVLVKMAFAPVNPSDLSFLTGNYGLKKEMPVVPGLEGSGIVVEAGSGFLAKRLLGKRVACAAPNTGNGTWAQFMLTDATKCVPLKEKVSLEQGSMLFVNPLTALAFIDKAKKNKADLIVMNAGGSALAAMVMELAKTIGITFLSIVRSAEGVKKLSEKCLVIDSGSVDFESELNAIGKKYNRAIFFDAVGGGDIPFRILNFLPERSTMVIYGRLSLEKAILESGIMIFKNYFIEGFWLAKELANKSILRALLDTRKVQKLLSQGYETNIAHTLPIESFLDGIKEYQQNMSAGKVLLKL